MESATKNKQSKEDILLMVRKAFGETRPIEDISVKELKEGFFNVAYEIAFSDRAVILKIAPPDKSLIMRYEKNIMKAEVDALRFVKRSTSVPVPEVYYYDDTHSICSADYFFMEKLEGESLFQLKSRGLLSDEENRCLLLKIGQYNALMNDIKGTCFGYIGQLHKQSMNWKETFQSMISDILKDGEWIDISLGVEYDEVRNVIEKASFALEEVKEPTFVHWDLWDGNVFVKDGQITGIIDFERALWGDPLMECNFRAHCYNEDFISGYGEDLRKKSPVRALLYDIYLYLIMVIETKFRRYPDDGQYQFATKELKIAMEELGKFV